VGFIAASAGNIVGWLRDENMVTPAMTSALKAPVDASSKAATRVAGIPFMGVNSIRSSNHSFITRPIGSVRVNEPLIGFSMRAE
jgi:hypothetical protein